MATALLAHEMLDAVSSYIAAAGASTLILAAAAIIATLVVEGAYMYRTVQALGRLT